MLKDLKEPIRRNMSYHTFYFLKLRLTYIKIVPELNGRTLSIFLGVLVSLNLLLSFSAYSQSDSLHKYLEIAERMNPRLMQKYAEYKAALQKIPQSGSLPDPELNIGVFISPMKLVNGKQVADIRLMQMFPWFGVQNNARDEMSLMAKAKFELFLDTKLQVLFDFQLNWYDLKKLEKEIIISEKNIEILKIIERLALQKYQSGASEASFKSVEETTGNSTPSQSSNTVSSGMQSMNTGYSSSSPAGTVRDASKMQSETMSSSTANISLTDIYRIQIETGDLESNTALLKNKRNTVLAQLNSYLSRQPLTPVFTSEKTPADSLELSLPAILDSIMLNNPILGMLNFEKQSIESKKKMLTHMGYPMVGIGFNYSIIGQAGTSVGEVSMNGRDMIMPMISITLPVYRKKYIAMKNEAAILKTASEKDYEATANSLKVEFYQAVQLYQDSKRRIKLFENQSKLASKSLDLLLQSFASSSSGLIDVLRVRQQVLEFELNRVEAIADFNTAVAWLKKLGNFQLLNIR